MEKAKYIENKEVTLFNDLDKSHKKLKEIANWYSLSDYNTNTIDIKNQKLYVEKINNIFHEMKTLLFATKNFKVFEQYDFLVTNKKLTLCEIEEILFNIVKQESKLSQSEYNLDFDEAIDKCLQEDYYIVGENFAKGCYGANRNGVIVLMEIQEDKISSEILCNLMISKEVMKQKFKTLVVANSKTLK